VEDRSAMVGAGFPPYSFTVERGKIKEFATAIGDMKAVYLDPEKAAGEGYSDATVPPTFGTVIDLWGGPGFMKLCENLRLNPIKVLHGEQEYEYLGDITAGDVITATTTLTNYTEKKNMYLMTMETVYVNQRKEEVQKCRQVVVELK